MLVVMLCLMNGYSQENTPPHIDVLQQLDLSWHKDPVTTLKLTGFKGDPERLTLASYNITRTGYADEFNTKDPFSGWEISSLDDSVEFALAKEGRLVLRKEFSRGSSDPLYTDSIVYGEYGPLMIFREEGEVVQRYVWEGDQIRKWTSSLNGFVTEKMEWAYGETTRIINGMKTNMMSRDTVRWQFEMLSKDTVGRSISIQGTDTFITSYEFFPDSMCIKQRSSSDSTSGPPGGMKYVLGSARHVQPDGSIHRFNYGEDGELSDMELLRNGLVQEHTYGDYEVEKRYYDDHESLISIKTFTEADSTYQIPSSTHWWLYYYQYDDIGNPTAILCVSHSMTDDRYDNIFHLRKLWKLWYSY